MVFMFHLQMNATWIKNAKNAFSSICSKCRKNAKNAKNAMSLPVSQPSMQFSYNNNILAAMQLATDE